MAWSMSSGGAASPVRRAIERLREVDVVAGRDEVGLRPECVALLGADGIRHRAPHRGGLAQTSRTKLEADQRRKRRLRGTAGCPPCAAPTRRWRRSSAAGSSPRPSTTSTQPSIRASMVSSLPSATSCSSVFGGMRAAARHRGAKLLRDCAGSKSLRQLLQSVGVDLDAAGEFRDRRHQLQPQPPRVAEQPRVRELAHREIQLHLVASGCRGRRRSQHVLGEQRRAVVEQRDADVATGDDLGRKLADDLSELHREQRAADVAHHLARAVEHLAHLFGRLVAKHPGERVGDRCCDGLRELGPDRHRGRRPLGAAHQPRLGTQRGNVGAPHRARAMRHGSACSSGDRSAGSDTTVLWLAIVVACCRARPQFTPSLNWMTARSAVAGSGARRLPGHPAVRRRSRAWRGRCSYCPRGTPSAGHGIRHRALPANHQACKLR